MGCALQALVGSGLPERLGILVSSVPYGTGLGTTYSLASGYHGCYSRGVRSVVLWTDGWRLEMLTILFAALAVTRRSVGFACLAALCAVVPV